jgi:hypothetical protein
MDGLSRPHGEIGIKKEKGVKFPAQRAEEKMRAASVFGRKGPQQRQPHRMPREPAQGGAMGEVIALDHFRQRRLPEPEPAAVERPQFTAGDVWGRDYTDEESILYGVFKVRDALLYYTSYDPGLDRLLLDVLEAAYRVAELGQRHLRRCIAPLKEYILDCIDEDNVKHMKTALILMDLIEKSPTYKS